jgi:hypothetical protein
MDDIAAIIMRAANRVEKMRQQGGPEVEGWVPLAHVPPRGIPVQYDAKRLRPAPQRAREPLPAGHPVAANILAGLITPWPGE